MNTERTQCKHGHPWIPENIYEFQGRLSCKECHKKARTQSRIRREEEPSKRLRKSAIPKTHCPKGHLRSPENYKQIFKNGKPNGLRCLLCYQNWYATRKEASLTYRLMKKYDMTIEDRDSLLSSQNGKCAGCGKNDCEWVQGMNNSWHIDHDHLTNIVRGILCGACNTAVGMVRDNVTVLQALIDYLLKHQMKQEVQVR